jgi:thiol-disulfide isomerase/thioredoxin
MRSRSFLFAALVLLACTTAAAQETDQNGATHAWKGPHDGYTVIDFAAAWCRPCWDVLPKLQALSDERNDIRFLVVSVDDNKAGRDALVSKLSLTLPVIWDEKKQIAAHYRPEGMPSTFVLDPSGTIVYRHVGSGKKEWDALVVFLETTAGK